MNQICRDIFRAIHEGKWLKIEYRNKADQVTKYWIGIRDIDPRSRTMKVDGLHLGQLTIGEYDRIFIDSILSTEIIEGTYCPENKILVEDIEMHPERYKNIFDSSANLKILWVPKTRFTNGYVFLIFSTTCGSCIIQPNRMIFISGFLSLRL